MKKIIYSFAAFCAALAFTACSNDDDNNNSTVNGSQEALDAACAQWKVARADWEWTEAFLFGAADEYSIDPHTDTWPVDQVTLASTLRDATAMADLDKFIKTANSGILGYHGIEYVLFRDGKARDISQLTELEYNYVCAVAKDLYYATCVLATTWNSSVSTSDARYKITTEYLASHNKLDDDGDVTGEGMSYTNFANEFKNPGSGKTYETALDATLEIIAGAQDIISEVGDSKIGLPHTGEDKTYIESPYAYNSITDFYDNIISCRNALYGAMGVQTPQGNSLIRFCLSSNNTTLISQAEKVEDALETALSAIKNMKAPFALYYADASAQTAMDALDALSGTLDDLSETLAKYSSNSEVQAQCQKINENYVDNIIYKSYNNLANDAEALYNAIVKIKK